MKRLLLFASLFSFCSGTFAQNTDFGIYAGAGSSFKYNHDAGISGGISFVKFGHSRIGCGAQLFYQGYDLEYDKEQNSVHNGAGNAGVMIFDKAGYIFVAPRISTFINKAYTVEAFINAGAGFKMSGTETLRKWDRSLNNSIGEYDSTINTSDNMNSMLIRVGAGLVEYLHMGRRGAKWWFTFTEDAGFLANSITKTSDFNDPSRTKYSPTGNINPLYISLQIGISRSRHVY